jgi:DNA helicase HerA-like ATPase
MLDFSARRSVTIAAGNSGSGKSTFALKYLVNVQVVCRFIFDPEGEYETRLGIPAARTPEELEAALASSFVIFDPHTMFPGNLQSAFAFFCEWAFAASERAPGRKILLIDEVWRYCDPRTIPKELALCLQTGRKRGLEMFFCTQRPHLLNGAITNEASEVVSFGLQEPAAIDRMTFFGFEPDELLILDPGHYTALNCTSGAWMRGRVF